MPVDNFMEECENPLIKKQSFETKTKNLEAFKMIKRIICWTFILSLVFTFFSVSNTNAEEQVEVYVDGVKIEFDVQPFIDSGYTMVPLRFIVENLGAEVVWNDSDQSVSILKGKNEIRLTIKSNRMIKNNEEIFIYTPAVLVNGRTMVPIRAIAEGLDAHVDWDAVNYRVMITTDNSLSEVIEKGEMIIGIDGNFVPMGFLDENDQYKGFDIDLAQEVANRLGIKLKIKRIDWASKNADLDSRNIDTIWSGMTITEERKKQVLFSEPYIEDGLVLVAKADNQIETREQLKEAKIGYLSDFSDYIIDSDNVIHLEMKENLKKYSSEPEMMHALDSGDIDAFIATKVDIQYRLIRDSNKYKLLKFLFDKEDWSIAFRRNDIFLRDAIQKTIDEMKKDGLYTQLLTKWFGINRLNYIAYDDNHNIIYNGNSYRHCKDYHWRADETGKRLGAVSQWGDYLKFNHLGMEFEAGVFEVKGSNGAALHINPPNSEFDALYLRSDIEVPELNTNSINRIELTKGYMGYDHIACDNGTTDKDVINEFLNLLLYSESAKIDTPYGSNKTVLLHSNDLPGCAYPILLYEKDGLSFLEFDYKLVIISEVLLNKLGSLH